LPLSMLDRPREAYTYPDINQNRLAFIVAKGSRLLGDGELIDGNAYYRRFRNSNFSSNVNDDYGSVDESGNVQTNQATNDRVSSDATSAGFALQWTARTTLAGRPHQFAVGGDVNSGWTNFGQTSEPATFTADRGTEPLGSPVETTRVALRNENAGIYASDTMNVSDMVTLTGSARYDHARVVIEDRSGNNADVAGRHRFSRLNPALGVNFNPTPSLTAYAAFSQGMRAPTAIELTCADPQAPCKLPNEFLADPPLAKVVASTIELGARGRGRETTWSAAVFRSELRDDLAFIASGAGASNAGFFQNVGRTRRQGLEFAATRRFEPITVSIRYNLIDARFRSTFEAESPNNSEADEEGAILVRPGNRIPGIPMQTAKLRVDWDVSAAVTFGASIAAASSQYAHGDENNADLSGRLPGYAVVHLDAQYRAAQRVTLFAQIENLFDRRYASFGLLGSNVFTGPGQTFGPAAGVAPVAEQFRALGTPRGIFAGVRVALDSP